LALGVLGMRAMGTRLVVAPADLILVPEDSSYAAVPFLQEGAPAMIELTVLDAKP
jgi:hypothetical protein